MGNIPKWMTKRYLDKKKKKKNTFSIRETEIKTTVSQPLTHVRMAVFGKSQKDKQQPKCGAGECSHPLGGGVS